MGGLEVSPEEASTSYDALNGEEQYETSSVQLFLHRCEQLGVHMEAQDRPHIFQIARLTGGMPLALELASAWVNTLDCKEILSELKRDLGILTSSSPHKPKQASIDQVFSQSLERLTPELQSKFIRLADLATLARMNKKLIEYEGGRYQKSFPSLTLVR